MLSSFRDVLVPIVAVAALVWTGAPVALADDPAPPTPGSPNAPTHGSLVDVPNSGGDSGWGYLQQGTGQECENNWVVCGAPDNPPESNLSGSRDDSGGWVSDPGATGAQCDNPGVVCSDVS